MVFSCLLLEKPFCEPYHLTTTQTEVNSLFFERFVDKLHNNQKPNHYLKPVLFKFNTILHTATTEISFAKSKFQKFGQMTMFNMKVYYHVCSPYRLCYYTNEIAKPKTALA